MKVEWMVYGPDETSDAGYQIQNKSRGIAETHKQTFINLCGSVPRHSPHPKVEKVYFGATRKGRYYLCRGEYVGVDRFGREGAWQYHGFVIPPKAGIRTPCQVTERLMQLFNSQHTKDPLEMDSSEVPRSTLPASFMPEILQRNGHLSFTFTNGDVESARKGLDSVIDSVHGDMPSYIVPASEPAEEFEVVGLTADAARQPNGVIPVASEPVDNSWARRTMVLLFMCAVAGIAFGTWGCLLSHRAKEKMRKHESTRARVETIKNQMMERLKTLRYVEDNKGGELKDRFPAKEELVKEVAIEVGDETYRFKNDNAKKIMINLQGLFDDIEALSDALSTTEEVQQQESHQRKKNRDQ